MRIATQLADDLKSAGQQIHYGLSRLSVAKTAMRPSSNCSGVGGQPRM
jgi:hypothetical protein